MLNIKSFLVTNLIISIFFITNAAPNTHITQNINSSNIDFVKSMRKSQATYICGTIYTYGAVLGNLSTVVTTEDSPFYIGLILGTASPVLIHIGHGTARNKAEKLLQDLPDGNELRDQYNKSRILYYSGFAPMIGAVILSTISIPSYIISDDPMLNIAFSSGAIFCLVIRDILWGKSMKGYIDIAKESNTKDSKLSLSLAPQLNIKDKTGGIALNLHF